MTDLVEVKTCTCPSGDGSLRWKCPVHPPNELISWSKPDWNAAPEEATHYYIGSRSPWRDLSGQDWRWWQDGRWRSPHDIEHAAYCKNLDLSSAGLLERNAQYLIARP